jgi:hypothetical protein
VVEEATVRALMSGDASTRVYERLHLADGTTRIFMDQPPKAETAPCPPDATPAERVALGFNAAYRLASGRVDAFVACARYLKSLGLSAPEIEAFDAANGLAVLEDLGDDLFGTFSNVSGVSGSLKTPTFGIYDTPHQRVDGAGDGGDEAHSRRLATMGSWRLAVEKVIVVGTGCAYLHTCYRRDFS